MKIGFVTCVQIGLSCLEAVAAHGGKFEIVITLPDDTAQAKSGRVVLDEFCGRTRTRLIKVKNINDDAVVQTLRDLELDWLLIIGWSQIARAPVLGAARLGTLGMHPTLLPKGRGRAAIPWAILKGLTETGVTMFKLDTGIDSGPIVAQVRVPIAPAEDAGTLYDKVSDAHALLLLSAWPSLMNGVLELHEQDHSQATTWPGRKPEDGNLATVATVDEAERLVRAVTRPYPGAFLDTPAGRVHVWRARAVGAGGGPATPVYDAACKRILLPDGALELLEFDVTASA
jgi:methionyl-tRNA formyltransferase